MAATAFYDVPAPAKLNLSLRLTGKRADGYHLLESTFVLIDWCDLLHFELRADGKLARHDASVALPADDLCLRAARALQQAAGTPLGADITVVKELPWAAGLGGGSSDAASTLLALNRLWRLDWPLEKLLPLGLALGADVPFFLAGHNAVARGIGELLTPATIAPAWFAVVKPAAGLETRAIFSHPKVAALVDAARIAGFPEASGLAGEREENVPGFEPELAAGEGTNDLQAAAVDLCPDVAVALTQLHRVFGNSCMTGSGSAVFAHAGAAGDGAAPQAAVPTAWPEGWRSRMCRSLAGHPLAGWAGRDPGRG